MSIPEQLRQAVKQHYNAEDVKVSDTPEGEQKVFAYGMMPDSTIEGWFPVGDLDEMEKKLRANGEL